MRKYRIKYYLFIFFKHFDSTILIRNIRNFLCVTLSSLTNDTASSDLQSGITFFSRVSAASVHRPGAVHRPWQRHNLLQFMASSASVQPVMTLTAASLSKRIFLSILMSGFWFIPLLLPWFNEFENNFIGTWDFTLFCPQWERPYSFIHHSVPILNH